MATAIVVQAVYQAPPMEECTPIIAEIVEPAIAQRQNIAVVIGVLKGENTALYGFGQLDGTGSTPGSATLYEIGSITKVFTTTLLACLVHQGAISLHAPVRQFLPDCPHFPPEITLWHLATHTSGLPRLPRNLWRSLLKNPSNPYAAYTREHLSASLKNVRRVPKFGQFGYSNLGMGLLGQLLERLTDTPYAQLIQQYITQPLGLVDTRIDLTPAQRDRLAPGHTPNGKRTANWDLPTLAGAGALHATGQDLLAFLAANQHTEIPHLQQAFATCHQAQTQAPGLLTPAGARGGLGWFFAQLDGCEDTMLWHNGGTGGYQTFAGLLKAQRLGVVVLINHAATLQTAQHDPSLADGVGDRVLTALVAAQS